MPRTGDHYDVLRAFGRRISRGRDKQGLTQQQLADIAGVSRGLVSRVECGRREQGPRLVTALRLAAALEVELAELVQGIRLP